MNDRRLTDALAEFQASIPRVAKDAEAVVQTKAGGTYGYKYADLASLTQIALPLLGKLGLSFTCCPTVRDDGKFVLTYALRFGGESIGGDYPLPASAMPQAIGSAITYGRRYCLCAVTGIAPDEDDDDAQEASQEYRALRNAPPEVDQYGAATFAEQTRMMTGPEPGTVRETATAGENTSWNAGPPPDEDPRMPAMRAMFALYKELGITDKDEMLADLTDILGRGIDSRADLSLDDLMMTINPLLRERRAALRAEKAGKR